ncbi:MAG: YfhO family protein, partial [Bacillota bacterium]
YQKIPNLSARGMKARAVILAGSFIALTILLFHTMGNIEYLALKTIVMDVVFFTATCFLLPWLRGERRRKIAVALICVMQIACLMLNAYYPIARLRTVWTTTADAYRSAAEQGRALVERIREDDGGLYRMERNFHRTDLDSLSDDYAGLTFFSAYHNWDQIAFCDHIGLYQGNYHMSYRAGTTPVLESLLGVKYILRKDGVAFEPLPEGYEELWRDGDVTVYENTYALPFAFLVPEQTRELSDFNPFVNQNILLSDLTGAETLVFRPIWDIGRSFDGTWETYTFSVAANRQLYMKSYGTDYVLNGGVESAARMNGSILLPAADADTDFEVKMTAPLGIHLAYFDLDAFKQAHAALAKYATDVQSDTDSHIVIHADVKDGHTQLLITIPYDKGWHVWVDGEKAEAVSRYGALLAVNLSQGAHTVELRFVPQGLWAGAAVSAASLVMVVLWAVLWRKKKRCQGFHPIDPDQGRCP